jgi:alpha-D-ribose 1-methylphosphonate 5-phosphate C-P lyase
MSHLFFFGRKIREGSDLKKYQVASIKYQVSRNTVRSTKKAVRSTKYKVPRLSRSLPAAATLGEITVSISITLKKHDGNTLEIDRALRGGQARSVK